MSRIVFVNGEFLAEEDAKISIFDRGFLMADAVYEVTTVIDGKLIDYRGHVERLMRSLNELEMGLPAQINNLLEIHHDLINRNALTNGLVYLQVTRGVADRSFIYPPLDTPTTLILFTQAQSSSEIELVQRGVRVITMPDLRWGRRDIKTVQLLYPSMAKTMAKKAGFDDAWLEGEDGFITEGTTNNTWIVTRDGKLVTRQLSTSILHGITRKATQHCAELLQLQVEERPYTKEEAADAIEAFFTSASVVCPVIEINGTPIGEGKPGPIVAKLREIYIEEAMKAAL